MQFAAVGITALILVVIVAVVLGLWQKHSFCPSSLQRFSDGSLLLKPLNKRFTDMNAFQQWWGKSGYVRECPLPVLTGARHEEPILTPESLREETYAKTPIYKMDDYELSRVFGYERGDHMIVPRQNFNLLMQGRQFDWADLPWSAEAREVKYRGLEEGFSAAGDLTREAVAQWVGPSGPNGPLNRDPLNRQTKEVAKLVAKAYADDPEYEPVVVQTGPHHWEVNELRPRLRVAKPAEPSPRSERIVNTEDQRVTKEFLYDQREAVDASIDPWYTGLEQVRAEQKAAMRESRAEGLMPWTIDRDPFVGPVPGLERAMGPTFDHRRWY
jgi:hypothetical protein